MSKTAKPIPDGFHTITPYLVVHSVPQAISFYKGAFGAVEHMRLTDTNGSKVRHAEIEIGDSRLFLTDIPLAPETRIPHGDDTCPVWLYLYVTDPDKFFDHAVSIGADVVTPMGNQPWGDRYGCLRDPFGYRWGIASRRENLSADETAKRMREAYDDD